MKLLLVIFLAGYLAAGVSQTGAVGTFGGMQIPSVAVFMDGYQLGVEKYNEDKSGAVEVFGWDAATQKGSSQPPSSPVRRASADSRCRPCSSPGTTARWPARTARPPDPRVRRAG